MKLYDEQGREYTPEQVRAAAEAMAKDEAGQGSFGGLNENQDGQHTPTAGAVSAADKPAPAAPPPSAPAAPAVPEETPRAANERELNPIKHPLDFAKTNLFGGFDAKYVTGKRPMTLFDYATDALQAYGGEDIGARNSRLIRSDAARTNAATAASKETREAKQADLTAQKTGLEVDKMTGDAIGRMMQDYDSDLWPAHLKGLAKEHGVNVPAPTISMVQRMTEGLNKEGAAHPADVLENPSKYSPELFNRVRHTMTLLNKNVQESQEKDLEAQKGQQALGIRPGEEQRKQTEFSRRESGMDEIVAQVLKNGLGPDGQPTPEARRRAAAILMGGKPSEAIVGAEGGVPPSEGGRGLGIKVTRDAAIAELQHEKKDATYMPSPNDIKDRMNAIEARGAAQKTEMTKTAGMVAEGRASAARALGQLSNLEQLASNVLTKNKAESYIQPIEFFLKRRFRDENMSQMQAVPGTLSNLARAMGEKGVLTEGDLQRVAAAVKPSDTDTWGTYQARLGFVKRMILRGQERLEQAAATGHIDPAWSQVDSMDLKETGGAKAPMQVAGVSSSGVSKTSGGTDDRRQRAEQWSARIKAEADPTKREELKQQAITELRQ